MRGLAQCMHVLKQMAIVWPSAGRAWDLLDRAKTNMRQAEISLDAQQHPKRAAEIEAEHLFASQFQQQLPHLHAQQSYQLSHQQAPLHHQRFPSQSQSQERMGSEALMDFSKAANFSMEDLPVMPLRRQPPQGYSSRPASSASFHPPQPTNISFPSQWQVPTESDASIDLSSYSSTPTRYSSGNLQYPNSITIPHAPQYEPQRHQSLNVPRNADLSRPVEDSYWSDFAARHDPFGVPSSLSASLYTTPIMNAHQEQDRRALQTPVSMTSSSLFNVFDRPGIPPTYSE